MAKQKDHSRVYICHTFYHVYTTFLKEFKLREAYAKQGIPDDGADLFLSTLSTDFGDLAERIEATGFFRKIYRFEEIRDTAYPELEKWRKDTGSGLKNLLQRIRFTSAYAKTVAPHIPTPLEDYGDIYVYCDSDPIGFYLNKYRIPYHAIEDGLNALVYYDTARFDNRGHFGLKVFFSNRLNLIFIQNGYGKYCIDMEVNDQSLITHPCPKYIDEPREALTDRMTAGEREILMRALIPDAERIIGLLRSTKKEERIIILTEPLCALDVRERIFRDLVEQYQKEGVVFLKPHPRDELDYKKCFPEIPQLDASVPMEMLNYIPEARFRKAISVLTETAAIGFADEIVKYGADFMDKYEDPQIHRQNETIGATAF
ncbi:MAG: lipooligosaccharide sialyltransferase [Lachnospiraceae bacterium]|nr:lipooligosaccharide sialyltransferase [Lachnospiraceae bacterium]